MFVLSAYYRYWNVRFARRGPGIMEYAGAGRWGPMGREMPKRFLRRGVRIGLIGGCAALVAVGFARPRAGAADGGTTNAPTSTRELSGRRAHLSLQSTSSLAGAVDGRGGDAGPAWRRATAGPQPRGPSICFFDNGAPLDDFGDPASQWSDGGDLPFIAGAADDFVLSGGAPGMNCRITTVRCAFHFFQEGAEDARPSESWDSVFVTVYPDAAGAPGGAPDNMGGQTGSVVVTREVAAGELFNEAMVGDCRVCWIVDIPVNFVVAKETRYWLSIVPRFAAVPQSAWCLSQANHDLVAQQGFPVLGAPFWISIAGNEDSPACVAQMPPDAGTNQDVSFVLFGAETPSVTGGCCDDANPPCQEGVSQIDCQGPNDRFVSGGACAALPAPPCGTTEVGACCLPSGACAELAPAACFQQGGDWSAGDCMVVSCPAVNDDCADKVFLTGNHVAVPFDTTLSTTPGTAAITSCGAIFQDIWFNYEVACDGSLTISTLGSSFDTSLAVYGPGDSGCPDPSLCPADSPAGDFSELDCNGDYVDSPFSYVRLSASAGQCLKIRVGGKEEGAGGMGLLTIDCIEPGLGACCHTDESCELASEGICLGEGDSFSPGQPCSAFACPPPCCLGDTNDDCRVDLLDVPGFTAALLSPPGSGSVAFCRADVDRDNALTGQDIAPFIDLALSMASCSHLCCPGDANGDGVLDALDVQGVLSAILSPPGCYTVEFCAADVNEDKALDTADVDAIVAKLLAGEVCPSP